MRSLRAGFEGSERIALWSKRRGCNGIRSRGGEGDTVFVPPVVFDRWPYSAGVEQSFSRVVDIAALAEKPYGSMILANSPDFFSAAS